MVFRLASRDNINSDKFDLWPAVLNRSFTKFNNKIESQAFNSEDEMLNWLDSRCRIKGSERKTNVQEFRNGDPNKIYSVYYCTHADHDHENGEKNMHDKFMYSLRKRRSREAHMTYANEKGERIKSAFKKLDNKIEFINEDEGIDYSNGFRLINREYFEGIYPLDSDENDRLQTRYLEFVNNTHNNDNDPDKTKKEIEIVFADDGYALRWLDKFIKKIECVERYLEFFSKGGDIHVSIEKNIDHDPLIKHILKLLSDNRKNTLEDDLIQTNIRNMIVDPYLCNGEVYQIRYNRTLMSWHKNYIHIVQKFNIIPSKEFADVIMNFTLMDFFKQIHPNENLEAMIKNIEDIYGIKRVISSIMPLHSIRTGNRFRNNDNPYFHKVTKYFNNTVNTNSNRYQ